MHIVVSLLRVLCKGNVSTLTLYNYEILIYFNLQHNCTSQDACVYTGLHSSKCGFAVTIVTTNHNMDPY
jgi:hypothetical protein